MTAVLSPTDALSRDPLMSTDDSDINFSSSTDWRAKYNEVADMLAETRAELDDFHHASKDLEAELEAELQRTERAQQDLRIKVAKAETERDDWKSKFMSLQTTHNSTTTSLQRELDKLRQEHQQLKVQMRELEMGNDDLERTERAVSSSLADVEAKYSRALEEKIILEHELLDKANLEEQCQRLKDEIRDANIEISVLKEQLMTRTSAMESSNSIVPPSVFPSTTSVDDLLSTPPPPDLQLSELEPSLEFQPEIPNTDEEETPRKPSTGMLINRQHNGLQHQTPSSSTSPSALPRSTTLPTLYNPQKTSINRHVIASTPRNPSVASNSSSHSAVPRSRGVQMVSEMRARVKNLEQKIHTRVPRLRMGSITAKAASNSGSLSSSTAQSNSSLSQSLIGKSSWEKPLSRRSSEARKSSEHNITERGSKSSAADSSGWVLIMEDSPSPPRKQIDRRRASSPSGTSPSSTSPTPSTSKHGALFQSSFDSGGRRPNSRLSAGSATTASSIPTSSSRPATPTFLPVPTAGLTSLKRSTGAQNANLAKRSSLGASTAVRSSLNIAIRERPTTLPPPPRSSTGRVSPGFDLSSLSTPPDLLTNSISNITIRHSSKMSPSIPSTSALSQSRIGRPSRSTNRRNSTEDIARAQPENTGVRHRSGSLAVSEVKDS